MGTDEKTPDKKNKKSMFAVRRNRFETKKDTIESLIKERKDLYERLQLSRDELDSYIRHMQNINDLKNDLGQQLTDKNMACEILSMHNQRLELKNKNLTTEINDLMALLCKLGPKELYGFEKLDISSQKEIYIKMNQSAQTLLANSPNKNDPSTLRHEVQIITKALDESNKKITKLHKIIRMLQGRLITAHKSKCFPTPEKKDDVKIESTSPHLNYYQKELLPNFCLNNILMDIQIENITDEALDKDLSRTDSPNPKYVGLSDCFSDHSSDDYVVPSEELNVDSIKNINVAAFDTKTTKEVSPAIFDKNTNIEYLESILKIKRIVTSFNTVINSYDVSSKDFIENSENENFDQVKLDRERRYSITDNNAFFTECECIIANMTKLVDRVTNMISQDTTLKEENKMLQKELDSLKYALTSRMELRAHRMKMAEKNCDCEEIKKAHEKRTMEYEIVIKELQMKLESLEDEKSNLFVLINRLVENTDS